MKSADFAKYLEESQGLERDYLAELVRSKKTAWRVAGVAVFLLVLSLVAVMALVPLKRVEPFLLRVDNTTGAVDTVAALKDAPETYGEAVDKYFVNKYVLARETYDYETLQASYDATVLLSSPDVQQEFRALYDGQDARDKTWSNRVRVLVAVRSITPTKDTAVVRFKRTRKTTDGAPDVEENLVATIGFHFVSAPMREEDRMVNPLGFQVTSYRVDPETTGG